MLVPIAGTTDHIEAHTLADEIMQQLQWGAQRAKASIALLRSKDADKQPKTLDKLEHNSRT